MFCLSDLLYPSRVRSNIIFQEGGDTLPVPQTPIAHLWAFLWPCRPYCTVPGVCVYIVLGTATFGLLHSYQCSAPHLSHGKSSVQLCGMMRTGGMGSLLLICPGHCAVAISWWPWTWWKVTTEACSPFPRPTLGLRVKDKWGSTAVLWVEEFKASPSKSWEKTRCHVLKDLSATITPWPRPCRSPPAVPLAAPLNGGADDWEVS